MYSAEDAAQLTYVQNGILAAILLNSGACDFVVTGCGTGEGAMLALNSFPNVLCGHVVDPSDAYMFMQINDGNAIALPFAKGFGWGAELNLTYIFEKLFEGERDLFRKCFAFYTTISADKNRINRGFDTSAIDTLDFMKIRRDLFPVIKKKNDFCLEERKRQAKQYISNLMQLTEKENEYMDRFMAKEYRPELLFDDEKIIARICRHPMAIWKCSKQP